MLHCYCRINKMTTIENGVYIEMYNIWSKGDNPSLLAK